MNGWRRAAPLALLLATACAPSPQETPAGRLATESTPTERSRLPAGFTARPAAGVERVSDGDTLVLASGERVRLLGIDTPELRSSNEAERSLARDAAEELRRLIADARVVLLVGPEPRDRFGRTLAYVHRASRDGSAGEDLGARLLESGQARLFASSHPRLAPYLQLQAEAREAGRGIWSEAGRRALGLEEGPDVDAARAAQHVGEAVRVIGRVFSAHRSERALFLNLGPDARRDFYAVVFRDAWALFPEDAESRWLDRRVAVRGRVETHRGRPQVVVRRPDQLELLDPP